MRYLHMIQIFCNTQSFVVIVLNDLFLQKTPLFPLMTKLRCKTIRYIMEERSLKYLGLLRLAWLAWLFLEDSLWTITIDRSSKLSYIGQLQGYIQIQVSKHAKEGPSKEEPRAFHLGMELVNIGVCHHPKNLQVTVFSTHRLHSLRVTSVYANFIAYAWHKNNID